MARRYIRLDKHQLRKIAKDGLSASDYNDFLHFVYLNSLNFYFSIALHFNVNVANCSESETRKTVVNQAFLDRIRIVLVNTTHPGNIGAVARAIKNMGLSQLVIVDPKDYPSEEATWRAANAVDVLEAAKVYPNLDEALAGCGLIVGTSARERKIPWPLFTPREIAAKAYQEVANPSFDADIALVFGREDRGLTNDELQKCHLHLNIPTMDSPQVIPLSLEELPSLLFWVIVEN